ncbi:MAG: tetratricopeptide repeat protein [Candidatus Krumholzibacteria bacterium]|nr:tetratricopeptide repeat protein [Candidatus Krumholzibacteria bacterium]
MNEKAASAQQKALQERKRGQHAKAVKRLEQAIAAYPDELDLYLDAVDACLEGGEVSRSTQFLKTLQERFPKEKDRIAQFVKDRLAAVHDPALARFVVENSIKLRDLVASLDHLDLIPDHTVRDLLSRTRTKKQSLKSASHGGYSLSSELVTNELMSALLSIRIGNMKEAVTALVQILDGKPVEQAILTPFLASLENKHPKSGRVRFAHAVAQATSGAELESIGRFVEAARLEEPVATMCVDRLRILRETSKARARVERALAEVYLIKGDLDDAAEVLRDYLAAEKDAGREVILMVKPFIDPARGLNACTWLALDASLTLEQSNVALEILRPLHQRADCGEALLDWFETKARNASLTVEMLTFHATLALDLKKHERAAEILRAVCVKAPLEVPAVLALLDRHRKDHDSIETLYREYAAKDVEAGGDATDIDDDGFQNFDNREFSMPGTAPGTPSAPRAPSAPKSASEQDKPMDFAAHMRGKVEKKSFVETREISFDDDGAPAPRQPAEPEASAETAAPADTDGFELNSGPAMMRPRLSAMKKDEAPAVAEKKKPVIAEEKTPVITEEHVVNVGQKLYETGAAAFFHVDAEDAAPQAEEPAPKPAPAPKAKTAAAPPAKPETKTAPKPPAAPEPKAAPEPVAVPEVEPESVVPATFEAQFAQFRNGCLDGARVIALMETAVAEGRVDALQELLKYEAKNDAESFSRSYFEAEHLIMSSRPLPAMKILAGLDTPGLSDDQKRRLWFRLAACQRAIHDFAAAQETLTRLVEAFPDREEYARLARTNFEQHLSEQSRQTPALQKTSSLD